MTERSKAARGAMALVLCMTMALAGCSTDWVGQAEQIVAALIPAAANIVALVAALEGKSVSASDLQIVQNAGTRTGADLQLIQALIAAYQKADDAGKAGILNQIQSAIGAAQANLQGLLASLHIKDAATQAKITAVVGILLSEVQSLAAIVPLVKAGQGLPTLSASSGQAVSQIARDMGHPESKEGQNPHPVAEGATRVGHPGAAKAPLSANEFVASYNATMTAKTGNADLDRATAGFKIHVHGKVVRVATAGVLK